MRHARDGTGSTGRHRRILRHTGPTTRHARTRYALCQPPANPTATSPDPAAGHADRDLIGFLKALVAVCGGGWFLVFLIIAPVRDVRRGHFLLFLLHTMLSRPLPVWAVGARPGDQGDASAASIRTFVAPVTLLVVVAVARGPILASAGPGA